MYLGSMHFDAVVPIAWTKSSPAVIRARNSAFTGFVENHPHRCPIRWHVVFRTLTKNEIAVVIGIEFAKGPTKIWTVQFGHHPIAEYEFGTGFLHRSSASAPVEASITSNPHLLTSRRICVADGYHRPPKRNAGCVSRSGSDVITVCCTNTSNTL